MWGWSTDSQTKYLYIQNENKSSKNCMDLEYIILTKTTQYMNEERYVFSCVEYGK